MLGNLKVEIANSEFYSGNLAVTTKEYSVTSRQWLSWYNKVMNELNKSTIVTEFQLKIGKYDTILYPKTDTNSINNIGGISWKQIHHITETIKKL